MDFHLPSAEYLRMRDSLLGQPCHRKTAASQQEGSAKPETVRHRVNCPMCGRAIDEADHQLHRPTDQSAITLMQSNFPGWQPEDGVCESCLFLLKVLDVMF